MVPRRAHLFTFYSNVGIPHFAAEEISFCLKYSLCYPSCVLFLPHRAQLLLWMVPHRAHLFTFYLKVGIPNFSAEEISFYLKYFSCYPLCALFSAPSYAVSIFNGAPSSAPVYQMYNLSSGYRGKGKSPTLRNGIRVYHNISTKYIHRCIIWFNGMPVTCNLEKWYPRIPQNPKH